MKILVAPNSFKESLDAKEVAESLELGIRRANNDVEVFNLPVSDGGDGILRRLIEFTNGTYIKTKATGPLANNIRTRYGILGDSKIALIESALVCGLDLVPEVKRDPTITTSYGLGELIKEVAEKGYNQLIIGLGGSATNDGGVGMLQALGISLEDAEEKQIGFGGLELARIFSIKGRLEEKVRNLEIKVACNPTSVLCGSNGTSRRYAKQKGATEKQVLELEKALENYGRRLEQTTGKEIKYSPGSGGAGGIGAGFLGFLDSQLVPSIDIIKKYIPIEESIRKADVVITAEGKLDPRSSHKITGEIARISRAYRKPIIAVCGQIEDTYQRILNKAFDTIYCISKGPRNLKTAIHETKDDLILAGYNIAKMINIRELQKA